MHGYPTEKIYKAWSHMIDRCNNPNADSHKWYWDRGIKIEDSRWNEYKNFLLDMKDSWKEGLTLERINNNKGYSKANCRWATKREQANNRRTNRIIEYLGEKKTLEMWIRYLGLKSSTVRQRYYCLHWPIEKCFNYNLKNT